ncbi:MAG: tRNA (adenosine(37)-N6)-dimethylallyltransferase MiaA [Lentisphaerae bacterium]|nr:tRNA (adenosine(37)-N6)-dimethylallyltransferase MiaA [Lentisphaerota bacterium]
MSFFPETIVITGPTATGKTALAVKLAQIFDGEIVSVDSRQVYRHMDIGSGKDLSEYGCVPYHLIDVADPGTVFDLFSFVPQAFEAVRDIARRGKLPILCGGSTMYLDALLRGYDLRGAKPDEELRKKLDSLSLPELNEYLNKLAPPDLMDFKERDNPLRVRRAIENTLVCRRALNQTRSGGLLDNALILGVYYPRQEVHARVELRLDERLHHGMIEEIRNLHEKYHVPYENLERYGLEYKFVSLYLQNVMDFATMRDQLLFAIRKFVKRQDIWFRKMEREGVNIHWLMRGNLSEAQSLVRKFLNNEDLPASPIKLSETFYGNHQTSK